MSGSILYLVDRDTPSFRTGRTAVDVVCAGASITGWNNHGGVLNWPYRTYPEFLLEGCAPPGLNLANGGIAGEIRERHRAGAHYLPVIPERPVLHRQFRHQRPRDVA